MPPPPGLDPRQLLPVAMAEAAVVASVLLRFALRPGEVVLSRAPHLLWLVGCVATASLGGAFFVVRTAALLRRAAAGEDVSLQRKQALAFSLLLLAPPLALSLAGPHLLASLVR